MAKVKQGILIKTAMGLECRYVQFNKKNGETVAFVVKEPVIFICHSSDLDDVLDLFAEQFSTEFQQYVFNYLNKMEDESTRESMNDNS